MEALPIAGDMVFVADTGAGQVTRQVIFQVTRSTITPGGDGSGKNYSTLIAKRLVSREARLATPSNHISRPFCVVWLVGGATGLE